MSRPVTPRRCDQAPARPLAAVAAPGVSGTACALRRRDFLRGAGSLALAPLVVPARVLGRGGVPPPSERITIGLIGVGTIGRAHLDGGRASHTSLRDQPDAQVVAACDADARRLRALEGVSLDRYRDWRELVAQTSIDAVVIATPDHWHAVMAVAAARAGKDIYGEKPLALTVREGRAVVDAVRRYGRVFQTGSQQRSQWGRGIFREACERVRSGWIGKLRRVEVAETALSGACDLPAEPVPEGLDWDQWLGPAPWRPFHPEIVRGWPGGWRQFRDYSGGECTDAGAHFIDILLWALGGDSPGPREVIPPEGGEVRHLTYVHPGGVEVVHALSAEELRRERMDKHGVRFIGSEGWISVDRGRGLRAHPEGLLRRPEAELGVRLEHSSNHHRNWLDCIRSRRRPIADVEQGHRAVSQCLVGSIARRLGRRLKWDVQAECFEGDEEANRMLDRPRRLPWVI